MCITRIFLFYFLGVKTLVPPIYGHNTSGTFTEPSAFWNCSTIRAVKVSRWVKRFTRMSFLSFANIFLSTAQLKKFVILRWMSLLYYTLMRVTSAKQKKYMSNFPKAYTIPYPSFMNRCIADVTERSMSNLSKRICAILPSTL